MKTQTTRQKVFLAVVTTAVALATPATVRAVGITNWVAFNDYNSGAGTGIGVSTYSPSAVGTAVGGTLTDYLTGNPVPVGVTILASGSVNGWTGSSGAPNAGTPADQVFAGKIDWAASALYHASGNDGEVRWTFTNLNPGMKYVFRGTAVRGNSYATRWSLATIEGVTSCLAAHVTGTGSPASPGIVTNGWAPYGDTLVPNLQAAWNSGENRCGDLIGWDEIIPMGNSFTVICSNWTVATPAGAGNTTYGYAFGAIMLAEVPAGNPDDPVGIVTQPPEVIDLMEGQPLAVSLTVTGAPPVSFQWFKDGSPILDATNSSYLVSAATPANSGTYHVRAENDINNVTSDNCVVTVTSEPVVITQDLTDHAFLENRPAQLSVTATGTYLHYQWYRDDVAIEGATGSSYNITNVMTPAEAGTYYVVITNTTSTATSYQASITFEQDVNPPTVIMAVANENNTITIFFDEPLDSTYGFDYANFTLWPDDGSGSFSFAAQNPVYDTNVIGNATYYTLTMTPFDAFVVGISYNVIAEAVTDLAMNANMLEPNPIPIALYALPLIRLDAVTMWKYDETGTDYSNDWKQVAFDDSGWSSGAALFEAKNGTVPALPEPVRTTMTRTNVAGTASLTTYYFRTHFDYMGENGGQTVLRLSPIIDDGAVFYLNGEEIFRLQMPAGEIGYNTLSLSPAVGDAVYRGPYHLVVSNLVAGDNVFAVEVHNNAVGSSDTTMGLKLSDMVAAFVPVSLTQQPANQTANEGGSASFTVVATGTQMTYQWFKDGVALTENSSATTPTLVIANATPADNGTYTVTISNAANSVTSDGATLTVAADTTAPTITRVVASTNLDIITITFSRNVQQASAENIANYSVALSEGGGDLTILSAILSGDTVTLTTSPRTASANYTVTVRDVRDTTFTGNVVSPNPAQQAVFFPVIVVDLDATTPWRFNDTGADLGEAWRAVGYDDSGWATGYALFDVKNSGPRATVSGETVRQDMAYTGTNGATVITYYFRMHFQFPSDPAQSQLQLRPFVDDGAVFYLNGQLLYNLRLTAPYTAASLSAGAPNSDAVYEGPFDVPASNLLAGDNVLAVELHQSSTTSSDATMGLQLIGIVPYVIPVIEPPTLLFARDPNGLSLSWTEAGFVLQQKAALDSSVPWEDVVGGDTSPVVVPTATGSMFYRLIQQP